MMKIKRTISILLICIMIVGGLCSCTSISTLIEESKTVYADGEIVYVKSIPEQGIHYVYILPNVPSAISVSLLDHILHEKEISENWDIMRKNKMLVILEVTADTKTDSEFSTNIDDMPELAVGNKIRTTYKNIDEVFHPALSLVSHEYDYESYDPMNINDPDGLTPYYRTRVIDSFDRSKLGQNSLIATTQGTVIYAARMRFDYQDVFIVYIDLNDGSAPLPYFTLQDDRFNMDDELYSKIYYGEIGYDILFSCYTTQAVDVPWLRYIGHAYIVE